MAKKKRDEQLGEPQAQELPPGVKLLRSLEGHENIVYDVAFDPAGRTLASGSGDKTVKLWEVTSGKLLRTLEGHENDVYGVAFDLAGRMLASASYDQTIKLWDVASGRLSRTIEGPLDGLHHAEFGSKGRLFASKEGEHYSGVDGKRGIHIWRCDSWDLIALIPEQATASIIQALAFHPTLPLLASVGSKPDTPKDERSRLIHLWELDFDVLLGKAPGVGPAMEAVHRRSRAQTSGAIKLAM